MRSVSRLTSILAIAGISLGLAACNSGTSNTSNNPSSSALNLAGTWTVITTSTQGHGSTSTTAALTQSGTGIGVDGSTTLSAPAGSIAMTESGTALSGTVTQGTRKVFSFSGTLSNGNLSLSGTNACSGQVVETNTIAGTVTSTKISGTYTLTRPPGCYYPNDAGTFTATKQ